MRKLSIVSVALLCLLQPLPANATAGTKCPKVGATKTVKTVTFVCTKAGKVSVWKKKKLSSDSGSTTTAESAKTLAALRIAQTIGSVKAPPPDATSNQGGPWATRTVLRTSTDGITFSGREVIMDQSGVPNLLATSSGALYAYFQDWANSNIISVAMRQPGTTSWQYYKVEIKGINISPGGANGVDPSAIELSDGRIRLFWMQRLNGIRIYSATSTLGTTNGISFVYDGGFALESSVGLYDPTVVQTASGWSMWVSADNTARLIYATSVDGLRFTAQGSNLSLANQGAFPWSAARVSNTEVRLLTSILGPGGADGVIYRSTDGGASFQELGRGALPAGAGGDAAITYQPTTGTWYQLYLERM